MAVTIKLDIPEHGSDPSALGLDLRLEALEQWLGELPLANADLASTQVLERLMQLNSARAEPLLRFQWLQRIQPVAEDLADTIHSKFAHALLPLTSRPLESFQRSADLNRTVAAGFKIVVHDLLQEQSEGRKSGRLALTCLYMAMHHYSLALLDIYSVYFPEPPGLWHELHSLFRFAEQNGVHEAPVLQQHADSQPRTVSLAYRRAALLAAANPYHLMQDEARTVFRLLYKLGAGCRVLTADDDAHAPCYYVDLEGDAPPRLALDSGDLRQAGEPRLFALDQLLAMLDKRIALLTDGKTDPGVRDLSPLARRLQRNMLNRLAGAWGRNRERAHERHSTLGQARLCMGLRAAYQLLSDNAPFQPEVDEVQIHTGYTPEARPEPKTELSLLPTDLEPWKMEEPQQHLRGDQERGRVSQFADRRAADVWEKIYTTKVPPQSPQSEDSAPTPAQWDLQNISARGFSVTCAASGSMPARVGEIIAYQLTGEGRDENWRIGCIRWLRVVENRTMELGVMQVDDSAAPAATRAIKGVGQGGEYFRSLIVPAVELMADAATLIVPAAIFDVGSLLAVNTGNEIHYVRLTRIVDATKSYSQFHFTIAKQPDSETKNIMSMRAML
ncbi:MAG: hypothetical protein P8076_09215 [Gammaproteobacteria bacterium]